MKRIVVEIDQIGRPKIDAQGFAGEECLRATAPIEKALSDGKGANVTVSKPEMEMLPEQEKNHLYEGF